LSSTDPTDPIGKSAMGSAETRMNKGPIPPIPPIPPKNDNFNFTGDSEDHTQEKTKSSNSDGINGINGNKPSVSTVSADPIGESAMGSVGSPDESGYEEEF
jgi:hypothetical protein